MKRICKSVIALMCSFCILANIGAFEKTASAAFHLDTWNWYHRYDGFYYYKYSLYGIPMYDFMFWDEDWHNIFTPSPTTKRTISGFEYANLVPSYVLESLIDIDLSVNPPMMQIVGVKRTDINKKVSQDLVWVRHSIA